MPTPINAKLTAINSIMAAIGEQPVNSLASGLADAIDAEAVLDRESRAFQTKGWHFNTLYNLRLDADPSDEFPLPANTLKISCVGASAHLAFTMRGGLLFDGVGITSPSPLKFAIGARYPIVFVDLVEELLFNPADPRQQLPPFAQEYITRIAARTYAAEKLPDPSVMQTARILENEAKVTFLDHEVKHSGVGYLNNIGSHAITDRFLRLGRNVRYGGS